MSIKIILVVLLCVMIIYLYARYLEQSSLYYPDLKIESTPEDIGINYEDVYFLTKDKTKLNGWFITALNSQYTVIFCHGNGGNISHRLDKISFFHQWPMNIFIFDYRGFGKSQGKPQEAGLYQDVAAAYKWVIKRLEKEKLKQKIIIYGESLGGAVAVDLAAKHSIDALILESTFTNVTDMAKIIYPFLPAVLIKSKFDSINKITAIHAPVLCMHSVNDEIVPFDLGKKLFEKAPQPKQFLHLQGAHNESFYLSLSKIKNCLNDFLKKIQ